MPHRLKRQQLQGEMNMKAFVAIAAALVIGCAQAASQWESQTSSKVDEATETFVKKAAQFGMGEVELGRWVQNRSDDAQVKQLGQHLADDHGKANSELRQIAERLGISMPTPLSEEQMQLQARLEKLDGAEFRREFVGGVVAGHKKCVADFQEYAQNGTNEEVRAFGQKYLPTLKDHLAMAQGFEGGVAMRHDQDRKIDAGYRSDRSDRSEEFRGEQHRDHRHQRHHQHDVSYDRSYSSSYMTSDDCDVCEKHVSYENACNTCEPSGGIVYDNDWRAGSTDLVTGEQVDLEQCTGCDFVQSIWR